MLKIGVVGCGYWGPNIVRNFMSLPDAQVVRVCDENADRLKKVTATYPSVDGCTDHREVTEAPDIDAVAVVTPVATHHRLGMAALAHGKHLFMEKPFTATVPEAEALVEMGRKKNLCVMVDHTFLFTGAVRKMKEIVSSGQLGKLLYYDSTRVNLGLFQHDVNVIWDLAPHDFSILDFITDNRVEAVTAVAFDHFNRKIENIAYVMVQLEGGMIAHFNLNWLSPVKVRSTLVGGDRKMLLWDDMETSEKIRVYDTGVDIESAENLHELLVSYRVGDMWSPKVDHTEALKLEASYFVECVDQGKTPFNDAEAGLRIVRTLAACEESIRCGTMQVVP